MENHYASVMPSPIGDIFIVADDFNVTEITFAEINIDGLKENTITQLTVRQLQAYFKGTLREFSIPTKQSGTEFQKEVWDNLPKIQYGETVSYAKFSAHKPLAIRAIATANGKNKLAIVMPCHRVIGTNGKLVGYAWGLWRKKWLLQHEIEVAHKGQTELKL